MSTRAELIQATSDTLAELEEQRRDPPDALIHQLNLGAKVAGLITREFPGSTEAGRVLVATSRAMAGLLESAHQVGLPCEDVARLIVSVLALAGEQTAHAETDQVLAYIADMRSDPEAAPPPLMDIAGRMAAQLSAQFPDDPALGRVVVAVGQAASTVAAKCEQAGMPPDRTLAVLVNAIAFAGQQITQRPRGGA